MKIELDTQFMTSDEFSTAFNIAVQSEARKQLSERVGTARTTTRRTWNDVKRKRFNETEIETIWKEYRNGSSLSKIARLINRPVKSIKSVVYRMSNNYKLTEIMKKVMS